MCLTESGGMSHQECTSLLGIRMCLILTGNKDVPHRERAHADREPGDSIQTPARSICLKFAGPTIRITRHLVRSFFE